jgi:hypothetical protein
VFGNVSTSSNIPSPSVSGVDAVNSFTKVHSMLSPRPTSIPETVSTLNDEEPSLHVAVVKIQLAGIVSWME